MKNTNIEWCDHSWSPWRGCTKVSAGCANCYAETLSKRNPAVLGQWGKGKPRVKAKDWNEPRKWNMAGSICVECGKPSFGDRCMHSQCRGATRRPTVFPSLCDIFDDEVQISWLAEYFQLVHETPNLIWLILTKRPENWCKRMADAAMWMTEDGRIGKWQHVFGSVIDWMRDGKAPTNVWVGTSVEDQPNADRRIPALLKIPARGRFLSLEPLLGPVRILHGMATSAPEFKLNWLIVGGESGNGSRPCNVEWIRSLVAQGKAAGVPTFVKQLGARPVGRWTESPNKSGLGEGWPAGLKITHPKGGDPAEWPADLRVREFPEWVR